MVIKDPQRLYVNFLIFVLVELFILEGMVPPLETSPFGDVTPRGSIVRTGLMAVWPVAKPPLPMPQRGICMAPPPSEAGAIKTLSRTNQKQSFDAWFAGIIDGDGNFDLRKNPLTKKLVLKAVRIKLHNRDIRILTRIQNILHFGRIRADKRKPYSIYIVSTKEDMKSLVQRINGLMAGPFGTGHAAAAKLRQQFG